MPELPPLTVADLHDRSVIPLWHTLCGVRLWQMRIGHAQLLEALELWSASEPKELLLAAFVCSRSPSKAIAQLDSSELRLRISLRALWLGRNWDWNVSRETWKRFVRYHMSEPFVVDRRVAGNRRVGDAPAPRTPVNTPWLTHLRVVLCGRCGYAPETLGEQPIGQAILDYYAALEIENTIIVSKITKEEMEQRRAISRTAP